MKALHFRKDFDITSLLEQKLEAKVNDVQFKQSHGELLNLITLARIYHSIIYCDNSQESKDRWLEIVSNIVLHPTAPNEAIHAALEKFDRIKHILFVGDRWNDGEWVLVLLLRLELEMVKDYFQFKKIEFPALELATLCEDMKKKSQTPKNKKDFDFSVSQMKKNSPLPFVDIWFEADKKDTYLENR